MAEYTPEVRPDRLATLVAQLETSWSFTKERFEGLTDAEYLWEPVEGCWSLRRRGEAKTSLAHGKGEWLFDFEVPEPEPPPVTTIAWRVCHCLAMLWMRRDYTFGARTLDWGDLDYPGRASTALHELDEAVAGWLDGLGTLADADLDTVGLCSFPYGLDPQVPFADTVWWMNRELIHHWAEVALLRDLYRARL